MNVIRIVRIGLLGSAVGVLGVGCASEGDPAPGETASSTGTTGGTNAESTGNSATASASGGSSSTTAEQTTGGASETGGEESTTSGAGSSGGSTSGGSTSGGSTSGGSTSGGSTGQEALEIIGEWNDLGGLQTIVISAETWEVEGPFANYALTIESYDNEERWLLATEEGGLWWWRQQWTYDDDDQLYHCAVISGAETMEDALAAPEADPEDLSTGCDGVAWHDLSPL